jgi:hypothetical protein
MATNEMPMHRKFLRHGGRRVLFERTYWANFWHKIRPLSEAMMFEKGAKSLVNSDWQILVLLLGIFRRVPCPSDTRGRPCALLLPRENYW